MEPVREKVILITGANRGIGFAITQATGLRIPTATYILACRSQASGEEAIVELRKLKITANLEVLELDITSDDSIIAAKTYISEKYGHLDVLINNAGIASFPESNSLGDLRENFNSTFNTNITSIYALTTSLLPLLHASPLENPKVINISSGRASLTRSSTGNLPPTAVVSYSISKVAVNALTIEMQRSEDARSDDEGEGNEKSRVEFYAANPGHCKTALNGFRGKKDPVQGAEVVARLVEGEKGDFGGGGFWEYEEGKMGRVPW